MSLLMHTRSLLSEFIKAISISQNQRESPWKHASQLEQQNLICQYFKHNIYSLILSIISISSQSSACQLSSAQSIFPCLIAITSCIMACISSYLAFTITSTPQKKHKRIFTQSPRHPFDTRDSDASPMKILYIMHAIFFTLAISYAVHSVFVDPVIVINQQSCEAFAFTQHVLLFAFLKREIEITVLLVFLRSQWWMRQVNICSNSIIAFAMLSLNVDIAKQREFIASNLASILSLSAIIVYSAINVLIAANKKRTQIRMHFFLSAIVFLTFMWAYITLIMSQQSEKFANPDNSELVAIAMNRIIIYIIPVDICAMGLLHIALLREFTKQQYHSLEGQSADSLIRSCGKSNNEIAHDSIQQVESSIENNSEQIRTTLPISANVVPHLTIKPVQNHEKPYETIDLL